MRGTITYSFVNSFTNEEVIPRTTGVDYKLLAQNPRLARALGYAMGDELHQCDVRRVGDAGSSPASGFGFGNFQSGRELIQAEV